MALTTKECLIGIDLDVITSERQKKDSMLEDITISLPKSNFVKKTMKPFWEADANVYMRVKGTNLVVMHVKNGYCIIIPEYMRTCDNKEVNVVDELSKYYYGLSTNGNVTTSSNGEARKIIYRQIMSIKYYGDINIDISEDMVVHHKGRRYINTEETMILVTVDHHSNIHEKTGKNSHRRGIVIHDVNELELFLEDLQKINDYLKDKPY